MSHDKRQLPYGGAFAVLDSTVIEAIPTLGTADPQEFCTSYIEWIKSTQLNQVSGIDRFPISAYSNGTSEVFDKFYMKNSTRRFRCFRGEYMYHQVAWRSFYPNWKFIEDEKLDRNDAVVISLPFSNTGNQHVMMESILEQCCDLQIPVLLDCAYFGVCHDINFNFSYGCITDIAFSLSKTFPVAHSRIGMRLTRIDDDDPMLVYHKLGYTNKTGSYIGLELIKKFSPDFIVQKYKTAQIELCKNLGIEASQTVLFGIDRDNSYPEYNRGGDANRLSLHRYLNG